MSRTRITVLVMSLLVVLSLLATAGEVMSNNPPSPTETTPTETTPTETTPTETTPTETTPPAGQPQAPPAEQPETPKGQPAPAGPTDQAGESEATGTVTPEEKPRGPESEFLEALAGRSGLTILADLTVFTDCNVRRINRDSVCSKALKKADQVAKKFAKLVKNIDTDEEQIVKQAAFLAVLKDNSNPPKLAFPSVHAAFPVIVKLARWGTSEKDPDKAASSRVAAQRLSILLTRFDLDGRSDQVAAEVERQRAQKAAEEKENGGQ